MSRFPSIPVAPAQALPVLSEAAITALRRFIERLPVAAAHGQPAYDLYRHVDGRVAGRVGHWQLCSRFAPVMHADGRLHALHAELEASLLPQGADPAAAPIAAHDPTAAAHTHLATAGSAAADQVFEAAVADEELVVLDRRVRFIHLLNFYVQTARAQQPVPLHLPIHQRLLAAVTTDHGRAFRRVIDSLGVPLEQVTLVLPGLPESAEDLQANVLASYRLNGFAAHFTARSLTQALRLLARIAPNGLQLPATQWSSRPNPTVPMVATGVDSATLRERSVEAGADLLRGDAVGAARAAVPQAVAAPLFTD